MLFFTGLLASLDYLYKTSVVGYRATIKRF